MFSTRPPTSEGRKAADKTTGCPSLNVQGYPEIPIDAFRQSSKMLETVCQHELRISNGIQGKDGL
jgi:hypothetical protein